jgi:hypothetical protein
LVHGSVGEILLFVEVSCFFEHTGCNQLSSDFV